MKRLCLPALILLLLSSCSGAQSTTPPVAQPTVQTTAEAAQVTPDSTDTQAATDDLAAELEGLDFDDFLEVSYRELLLRDPESVIEVGLAEIYGLEGVELTNVSDAYIRETYAMHAVILDALRTYNRDELTPEQQISYDVYEWYLDDVVRGQEFMYCDYPATFLITTSIHLDTEQFFTDIHPITNRQDAEDYITRLSLVDTKFEQLIEGLQLREEAGIVPPRFAIQWALYGMRDLASGPAQNTSYYTAFAEKVNALSGLSDKDKKALLGDAEKAIEESVIPAYQALVSTLEHLESIAPTDDGVWQFEGGDEYYAYVLRHHTTTDMTADEIHQLGLQELERIQNEMRAIFDELGYPENESLPELFKRVADDSGYVSGEQVVETYEAIIEDADQNLGAAFDILPRMDVIVIGGPVGAFYVPGSVDGLRPGAFYADVSGAPEPYYPMPSLTYHETIPGHHLQIALALESHLPSFRKASLFNAHAEGWALYAERLAWELGWYEDDPYGNLGRLQYEAFRAARLVVDTGIHSEGWTFDQAQKFMIENTGFDANFMQGETGRYIAWPGQATAYKVGMLKILELRQRAMDALGDSFDLKEFHTVVLSSGGMPLEVLERVVEDYIEAKLGQ